MNSNWPRWTCTGGQWLNGSNRGTTVYWLAPDSENTGIELKMYENDLPTAIVDDGYNCTFGSRDDDEALQDTKTIKAIVPELDQVTYGVSGTGAKALLYDVTTPEWKRDPAKNEPVCWVKKSNATASPKFWHSENLTVAPGNVEVRGETSNDDDSIGDWKDAQTSWGTSWPQPSALVCESGKDIKDEIQKVEYTAQWRYRCTSGTNNWIDIPNKQTGLVFYVIYASPLCASSEFTVKHLGYAVSWANGGKKVTENDIPKKIEEKCWLNFTMPGHLSNPWDLETTRGDCQTHAELMAAALKVLGINADGTTASICRVCETRMCPTHGAEYHYFVETRGAETNFEGVCKVSLIDESTPWDCYYDKAMGGPYQEGSHTNMWTEWNSYPPPNYKVIHHFTYWENH
jgi:hypothetical protein